MKLYSIKDWEKHYELRDTKRMTGALKWIPITTKTDGFGFGLLRQQPDSAGLLAAWYLMLGVAAKQNREHRGQLARDGIPLTADDLELMTGFRAKLFDRAFDFFSQPRPGWLVAQDFANLPQAAAKVANAAANPQQHYTRLEENRIEDTAAGAAAAPDFLAGLKTKPAYRHVDVDAELQRAETWCSVHNRKLTRRFFVNWINRIDKPIGQQSRSNGRSKPDLPEPDDWRAWINENAPDAVYARGNTEEGKQWNELDHTTQKWITQQLTRNSTNCTA